MYKKKKVMHGTDVQFCKKFKSKVNVHCLGYVLKAVITEKTIKRGNENKNNFYDNYNLVQ